MNDRPKILVVDKDENILSAFGDYMSKKNYLMIGVNNVKTGLREIREQDFHLLITDIRVNSEFGTGFISQVKSVRNNLPIIAITSYPDKITEPELKAYGANYLFIKPLELNKLDQAVTQCLQSNYR